jgi:hypothetical protein
LAVAILPLAVAVLALAVAVLTQTKSGNPEHYNT